MVTVIKYPFLMGSHSLGVCCRYAEPRMRLSWYKSKLQCYIPKNNGNPTKNSKVSPIINAGPAIVNSPQMQINKPRRKDYTPTQTTLQYFIYYYNSNCFSDCFAQLFLPRSRW